MLTSVLRKLKLLISRKTSPRAESWSEEISEPKEENNMQNTECTVQNLTAENEAENKNEIETRTEAEENSTAPIQGNLSHLSSSVPRAASLPKGAMTKAEMAEMRDILGNVDDAELHRLYKRVTN